MNKYLVIILSVVVLVVFLFIILKTTKTTKTNETTTNNNKIKRQVEEFQNKVDKINRVIQENFTTTITSNKCIYTTDYGTLLSELNGTGGLIEQLNTIADDITLAFPPSDSDLNTYYNKFLGDGITPTPLGSITDLRTTINSWIGTPQCSTKCDGTGEIYNTNDNRCECDYANGYIENNYNDITNIAFTGCIDKDAAVTGQVNTITTALTNMNLDSTILNNPTLRSKRTA